MKIKIFKNLEVGIVLIWIITVAILSAGFIISVGSVRPWMIILFVSMTVITTTVAILVLRKIIKNTENNFRLTDESSVEAHKRTLLMLDACPMCTQIWDKDLNTIDCNEAGVKLYGFKDKQEYLKRFLTDCSPEYQPDGQRSDEKAQMLVHKAFNEGICEFDWMHKMPDEDIMIPCEIILVKSQYNDEDVVIGYTRDMRKVDEIMRELEIRDKKLETVTAEAIRTTLLNTLFNTIPDLVFAKDANSRFIECNNALLENFNIDRRDIIGKDDAEALGFTQKDTKSYIEWDRKVIKSGIAARIEHRIPRYNGTMIHVETIKTPLVMNGETVGVLGVSRDITRFKEMERRISADYENARRLQAKADLANHHKSLFLATMSHEIRTPMNAILGATEVIMQSDSLPPEIYEWLSRIYNSGNLLLGIINDILDFSKIEAGKLEISISAYQLASVISDSIQLNLIRGESKLIEFVLELDDNIPSTLIGDELRIKQILNNLLSNAFKFTESGKITLTFKYEKGPNDDCIMLIMGVRDTGIGITADQQERLFNEYARFIDMSQATIEGTGLGLSITRRLLDLMDGEIIFESAPGVGSYFEARLPQRFVGDDVLGPEVTQGLKEFTFTYDNISKRRQNIVDMMPYGNVLVVDDVETNRFVAVGLLMIFRLNVETVSSGYDAIEMIENGKTFDLIFMDHMMPGINGIDTTKRLRELGYQAPIVALTANVASGNAEMFIKNGFDNYLPKPIDIRQLTAVLNKYIRDKQPREVIESLRQQAKSDEMARHDHLIAKEETEHHKILMENLMTLNVPGIDIKKGIERYGGDVESYYKILRSYAANVRSMLDDILLVSSETMPDYTIKVHSIKGTSADVFADRTAKMAKALEDASREENIDFILENNLQFINKTTKMISKLEAAISEIDDKLPRSIKDKPDDSVIEKLRSACKIYDMDGVDSAMAEIDAFSYSDDDGLVEWLKAKVDLMSFSEIVDRLSK